MRKIRNQEEKEKIEKRNKLIVGVVLIGIMLLSTLGYAFYNTGREEIKKEEYNGVKFSLNQDGFWYFNIENSDFSTTYTPEEVNDISLSVAKVLNDYSGKVLYFSYDSDRMGVAEIGRNFGGLVNRASYACIDECEENLPIKDCSENVIIIKEADETLIKQQENCIYISAKKEDIVKASDAFIFKVLKVL